MELLESHEDRGYPTEYLLSRIRGRRANLIKNWKPLILDVSPIQHLSSAQYRGFVTDKSSEGVLRDLMKEYRWVYCQMNRMLMELFKPFFLFTELRTLFICLRFMKDRKSERIKEVLRDSLLSEKTQEILKTGETITSAVQGIEDLLMSLSGVFRGLTEIADKEGVRALEQQLTNRYLVYITNEKLHPYMRSFFIRIIDSRNIMSLYKHLRLNIKAAPSFIPGGSIPEKHIRELMENGNVFRVSSIIHKHTGINLETPNSTQVENALYKGITGYLNKVAREPLCIGLILDYLWRCSIEAMNLSILFYGKDLERDTVTAEVVQ